MSEPSTDLSGESVEACVTEILDFDSILLIGVLHVEFSISSYDG